MSNQIAVFIDFENVALWAEQEFLDLELSPLMEYLQGRGPVVIKQVYGDWSRFARYREDLMNNSVDLVQIYSVRAGKNRADIRMALDAFETAITREQVRTFVIVSGDSDFGPLVNKLREYGRYTLGIGPRDVTHPLLVKACDEFVYLEAILDDSAEVHATAGMDLEAARTLLEKALRVHTQRGDLPVLAAELKSTMLLLDSAFSEANFGYSQFRAWLENNADSVNLFVKEMQLYVAPKDFTAPSELNLQPWRRPAGGNGHANGSTATQPSLLQLDTPKAKPPLRAQYKQIFNRLKMTSVDFATRATCCATSTGNSKSVRAPAPPTSCWRNCARAMNCRASSAARRPCARSGRWAFANGHLTITARWRRCTCLSGWPTRSTAKRPLSTGPSPALSTRDQRGLEIDLGEMARFCSTIRSRRSTSRACWTTSSSASSSPDAAGAMCCRGRASSPSATIRSLRPSSTTS
ncbi:MAG: NYN domain-containing protein [Caldilineaceae bacterium]